jgi:hypothetical protein
MNVYDVEDKIIEELKSDPEYSKLSVQEFENAINTVVELARILFAATNHNLSSPTESNDDKSTLINNNL